MSYLVLARKWRPRSFETLVGQDHVVRALTNALDTQRLHHAWLFTGTRGVGKTTLSRILAKSLNCETGITSKPCSVCRACVEIDEGRFVDYLEFDAASNRRVEEMTQLLEQAVYAPSSGRYKIYMIDEVHMLSGHAFNAMLKTLEEPPPHIKFILATTDPQKMPVTVLSRCLQFNLKQMPPDAIVSHLNHVLTEEGINFEIPGLRQIAQAASGSMRDALSLTDQAIAFSGSNITGDAIRDMLGTIDQRFLVRLLDSLNQGSAQGVLDIANELYERGYSFAGALADLAVLLSQIAIEQRLPGSALTEAVLQEDIVRLARTCHPDTLQLFYSIAVHGRNELALSPDEYAGFVMTCLRMLSLITSEPAHSTASEWHSGNGSASHKAPAAASAKAEAHGDSHSSIPAEQGGSALQGQEESDASASGNAGTTGQQKKNLNDVSGAQVTSQAAAMAGSTQSIAADVDSAATATVSAVSEGDASASQSDRTSHSRLDESVGPVVDESADFDPDVSHVGGSQANESFNPQSSSRAPHVIASDIDTREPVARENALPVKLAPQREPILVPPLQSTAKSANERPAWEEEPGNAECAETQLAETSQPRHENVKSDNFNRENISTGETRETGEPSSGPPVWEDIPPDWEAAGLTGQTDEDGDIVPVDNMPGDMDQTWVPAHDDPQARRPLSAMNAREWVQLVAELPLNGYAAEMARRCEWMGHQRNKITLRIPVKGQNDLNSKIKLETALSEYFHEVVRVDMVFGQTGDDTLHAVEQAEREALQKRVEKAVQENEFINTLIADLGARIVPGSIEPFSQKSS